MSNVGIIGGADGPTAIFVTSALPRMLNPWGMVIILLMMIPNVIFALRHRNMENRCKSRFINILEQIGRYGCLVLMIICIGLDKFGFGSVEDFLIYLFGSALLLLAYFAQIPSSFAQAASVPHMRMSFSQPASDFHARMPTSSRKSLQPGMLLLLSLLLLEYIDVHPAPYP